MKRQYSSTPLSILRGFKQALIRMISVPSWIFHFTQSFLQVSAKHFQGLQLCWVQPSLLYPIELLLLLLVVVVVVIIVTDSLHQ